MLIDIKEKNIFQSFPWNNVTCSTRVISLLDCGTLPLSESNDDDEIVANTYRQLKEWFGENLEEIKTLPLHFVNLFTHFEHMFFKPFCLRHVGK